MSDEKKESKVKIEDLPTPEKELSKEEAQKVKGGGFGLGGKPTPQVDMADGSVKFDK